MNPVSVSEEMKTFNVTKFISGTEPDTELSYYSTQASKCASLPKYSQAQEDGQPCLTWKDAIRPWLVQGSLAMVMMDKQACLSPTVLFDMLKKRKAPRSKDFDTSMVECIQKLVVPNTFDHHQVTIEKYAQDYVERRYNNSTAISLNEVLDLSQLPIFSNGRYADVLEALAPQFRDLVRTRAEPAIKKKVVNDISAELGMAIISSDTTLFSVFSEKKPNDCSLTELVDTMQEKHLEADPLIGRPAKYISLRYQNMGKSPLISIDDHEKNLKRKQQLIETNTSKKASKTDSNQSPQVQNNNNNNNKPSSVVGNSTGPDTQKPKPKVEGKPVAIPCKSCLVSPDQVKKDKARFHLYETCFDHPTLGIANKSRYKASHGRKEKK